MRKKIIFLTLGIIFFHLIYTKDIISAPLEVDIAGVKLGMTPSQAEAALVKFNAGFKIEKKFRGSSSHELFEIESKADADITPPGILSGLEATVQTEDGYELVWTYFSPLKEQDNNNERVVAILRWKTYLSNYPQVVQLVKGLSDKIKYPATYSRDSTSKDVKGYEHACKYVMWCFNDKGNVLQAAGVIHRPAWGGFIPWEKGRNIGISSFMPQRLASNEPISLQLVIESPLDNSLLAQGFSQILLAPSAYIKAFSDGKKIIVDTAKATLLKRQQDAAATSDRKEQF